MTDEVAMLPGPRDLPRVVFEVLDGIIPDREAVYVSVPITTGKRFLDWRRGRGAALAPSDQQYRDEHRVHVVEPNREQVAPVVQRIRERLGRIVIDPTALGDVSGWAQSDYHRFWTGVIERYVHTVVFLNGWEYSSGCPHEFLAAIRVGAELLREDLAPLRLDEGERQIREAIAHLDDDVLSTVPLRDALQELHRLTEPGDGRVRPS
jgi:hypothetical protein